MSLFSLQLLMCLPCFFIKQDVAVFLASLFISPRQRGVVFFLFCCRLVTVDASSSSETCTQESTFNCFGLKISFKPNLPESFVKDEIPKALVNMSATCELVAT